MKKWMICVLLAAVGFVASIELSAYAVQLAESGSVFALGFAAVALGFFGAAAVFLVSGVRSLVLALS